MKTKHILIIGSGQTAAQVAAELHVKNLSDHYKVITEEEGIKLGVTPPEPNKLTLVNPSLLTKVDDKKRKLEIEEREKVWWKNKKFK